MSPAYDIVPTVFFQSEGELALSFGGKRSFERITGHDFERMASYVDMSPRAIMREVAHTIERACDTWPKIIPDLPWPRTVTRTLAARWLGLPLFKDRKNPFG